jgi:hypothetical protein
MMPDRIEHQCAQYHQLFDFLQQQSSSERDDRAGELWTPPNRKKIAL